MDSKDSLLCLQEPPTDPYLESHKFCKYPLTLLNIHLHIIVPYTPKYYLQVLKLR
jgi:hypothetical protein